MNFKTRGFVSITLALSFIILSLSGIVLYIMPHGRVAYWINWKIAGLSKDDWDAVHTIIGFVFMITAAVHFSLNWAAFMSYLKSKAQKIIRLKKELVASVILLGIITGATIGGIPPFSTIMDIGETTKESWDTDIERAPIPHAELMTLDNFIQNLGLSHEEVVYNLESYGIKIESTDETLKSIAQKHNMSPHELYRIIQPRRGGGKGIGGGRGIGVGRGRNRLIR